MLDRNTVRWIVLLMVLAPLVAGCTLIGLSIGAAASKKTEHIKGWEVLSVEVGRKVTIVLKDGTSIEGKYRGANRRPKDIYEPTYSQWLAQQSSSSGFPPFGASVKLAAESGEVVDGTFYGVDHGVVYVASEGRSSIWDVADVDLISDSTGNVVSGVTLAGEVVAGDIPLRTSLIVDTPGSSPNEEIDVRKVQSVTLHGNNAAAIGLAVGLLIDAAIVIAVATSDSDWSSGSSSSSSSFGSSSGSCPFVYSHDGEGYVFDAEPLGGLFFRGVQRPDFTRLNHLRSNGGEFRLRVTTELDEVDYVDAMQLHIVEHERDSEVVPSAEGHMVVFTHPEFPRQALTFQGADVTEMVRSRDGLFWSSNPFGRDLNDPLQLRDGLILEFGRRLNTSNATLAVTVKNLPWTDGIPFDFFSLAGENLPAMYDQLNSDPTVRQAFLKTIAREVLLRVEVWDGTAWQTSGSIVAMGPRVSTDRALSISLPAVSTDQVRIRLSAMAGMWSIDRVMLDYTPASPTRVLNVRPSEAVDHTGSSVLAELEQADAEYLVSRTGDVVDFVFSAPDAESPLDRTMVLETSGYYTINVDTAKAGNDTLIKQLMSEPGALSRWALQNLYDSTSSAIASLSLPE